MGCGGALISKFWRERRDFVAGFPEGCASRNLGGWSPLMGTSFEGVGSIGDQEVAEDCVTLRRHVVRGVI